ncbi:MAG: ABC transporter ATP-binding protein [Candidatus Aminicenantales bacterium]
MNNEEMVLKAEGITKIYKRGSKEVQAISRISLRVGRGEFVCFIGPSGSGKTTLINVLGCLDSATSGTLVVGGMTIFCPTHKLSETKLTKIGRSIFGNVFQRFYLILTLTVFENVILPFSFYRKKERLRDPKDILRSLGLEDRMNQRPNELSAGEMQQVAIARALVNNPEILLADEPTENLDSQRSQEIGQILKDLNGKEGLTVLLVTHNSALARLGHQIIELRDGRIQNRP